VLVHTNLDNPQESTAAILALLDSLLDKSSLIVGQVRIVAWCVTDPSGRRSHTTIMSQRGRVGGSTAAGSRALGTRHARLGNVI
jgi:hypothetical protein